MPTAHHIHNAAEHLLKQHGRDAGRFAMVNADRLAERQDDTGAGHWQSIAEVVKGIEAGIAAARRTRSRDLAM